MKYVLLLCVLLSSCIHSKEYKTRLKECKFMCKPYEISFVSAKNECVCDLSELQVK